MIDLHTHSTYSDGTFNPTQIIATAVDIGLTAIALTDHDTIDGLKEAGVAAANLKIIFVPGVEISAKINRGALHILGLQIDPDNSSLVHELEILVEARVERNLKIASHLNRLGLPITYSEVEDIAGGAVVGRPHFATLMKNKGYVKTFEAAFHKYLARGKPAYAPKFRLLPERAIEIIRSAGGVPIMAHPSQTLCDGPGLEKLVKELVDLGLEGIEAYYPGHSHSQTKRYKQLAKKFGLVLSGGSDFHGTIKPGIALGRGPGQLNVPDGLMSAIAARADRIKRTGK
jgi:3',5'-nucleoside bisphosphate phosphatase